MNQDKRPSDFIDPKQVKKLERYENRTKRALRRRVMGKPSHHQRPDTLFQSVALIVSRVLKIVFLLVLVVAFLLLGLGSGMLAGYISTVKDVQIGDIAHSSNKTTILDRNGAEVTTLTSSSNIDREFVPFSDLEPTYIEDAFIAIEDERFRTHPGIDPKRIGSAVISALINAGTPTHGGSTITQQTIKLISGADDISAQRKIQEWYNAWILEKSRSKEGILELYLNLVPMANNIVGVQAAAKAYFNKDARNLSLLESAYLAGMPNQPTIFNPKTEFGRRNGLRRMRLILSKMLEQKIISEEQYEQALNTELVFDFTQSESAQVEIQSWFVDYLIREVISDLVKRNGYSPALASMAVYNQGLTIETTLDPVVQKKLEEVFKNKDLFAKDPNQIPDSPEIPQSAITVLENNPRDPGRIRGMVGGFGEKKPNAFFNRAVDAQRQPGSSIKPLVVYAPALEIGKISDATIFQDKEVFLNPADPNTPYPLNFYRSYLGSITLQQALVRSVNTVAADLFTNVIYPETGLEYLKQSGIDRTSENYPSTALGGLAQGVSTYEMAGAYSVLANQGIYVKPSAYTRVLRHDGTILLDNTAPEQTPVYRPATTYVLTRELEHVATNVNATPPNMHAAGKTGTTDEAIDVWFCGYTPYYTAAVWYGYDNTNGRRMQIPEVDWMNAVGIWNAAMTSIHESLPERDFEEPDGVTQAKVCTISGDLAGPYCPAAFTALLIDDSPINPDHICTLHKPEAPKPTQTETDTPIRGPEPSSTN